MRILENFKWESWRHEHLLPVAQLVEMQWVMAKIITLLTERLQLYSFSLMPNYFGNVCVWHEIYSCLPQVFGITFAFTKKKGGGWGRGNNSSISTVPAVLLYTYHYTVSYTFLEVKFKHFSIFYSIFVFSFCSTLQLWWITLYRVVQIDLF